MHLPTPAKVWRVVPPSAQAASPVEAVTKVESSGRALRMCFSTSDLPVPAQRTQSRFCEAFGVVLLQRDRNISSKVCMPGSKASQNGGRGTYLHNL